MKLLLMLICGVLLAAAGMAPAAERPVYPCYRVTAAPVIDGKLDDPVWATLPKAGGFLIPGLRQPVVQRQTEFRLGYDEQYLYVAVRCLEPHAGKPKVNCGEIELFVTTQMENPGVYYQFGINADGTGFGPTRFIKNMTLRTQLTNPGYATATHIETGSWCCEARIPFSLFNETREQGKDWLINLCRYAPNGSADGEAFSTWSFLPKLHWHLFIHYNPLQFQPTVSTPAQVAAAEKRFSAAYQHWQHENMAAYTTNRVLRARVVGAHNLAVNAKDTPANAQVKDNAWGSLVGQAGVNFRNSKIGVLEVTWPKPIAFDTVVLPWADKATGSMVQTYTLEYWDGQHWQLLADVKHHEDFVSIHTFPTVTGAKLRIRIFDVPDETEILKNFGVYLLGVKGN